MSVPATTLFNIERLRRYDGPGWFLGGGFVAGTLFVDSVELGDELPIPQTSTLYYDDGETVLAKLGENERYVVPYADMSPYVTEAIVASEDRTFWTNEGVEFTAILRAALSVLEGCYERHPGVARWVKEAA